MYITEKKLVEVDGNQVLWKYMNFTTFYRMLLTRSLFFRRLDSYTDNMEGTLPEETREALYQYRLKRSGRLSEETARWLSASVENIESYKAFTLANAWSINDVESYAMWKIYLHGHHEGIAIKTTVSTLTQCLDENDEFKLYSGKVTYEPIDIRNINIFSVATNKRQTYSYENEYRALLFNQHHLSGEGERKAKVPKYDVGVDVRVNLVKLISEVLISPFSESWFDDIVRSALSQLLPDFDISKTRSSMIKDR